MRFPFPPLSIALLLLTAFPALADEPPLPPPPPENGFRPIVDRDRSLVFVLDASAAAAGRLPGLSADVEKAIAKLKPDQSFGVVSAADGKVAALDPKLLAATPENRAKLAAFLKAIKPAGKPATVAAIRAGLAYKADMIRLVVGTGTTDLAATRDAVVAADAVVAKTGGVLYISTIYVEAPEADRDDTDVNTATCKEIAVRCAGIFFYEREKPAKPNKAGK